MNKKVAKLQSKIYKLKQKLWKEYQRTKPTPVEDFELWVTPTKKKKLSELFGKNDQMIVFHNMGMDCAYCTLWADGINGFSAYLPKRAGFLLENDETPAALFRFAAKRKWKFPVVSSKGTKLKEDMGFQKKGDNSPGISSLIRDKKGRIYQVNSAEFGPGDDFCSIWDTFALLPGGEGKFAPNWDL